jgi:hypothetical protein
MPSRVYQTKWMPVRAAVCFKSFQGTLKLDECCDPFSDRSGLSNSSSAVSNVASGKEVCDFSVVWIWELLLSPTQYVLR